MNKVIDRRPQCPPPLRVCLGAFIYPIRLFFARGIYYICSVFHIYPASLTTYRPRQPHSFSSSLNQPLILPIGVRPARKTSTTTHTIPNFHPVYRHCTVLRCTLRCALPLSLTGMHTHASAYATHRACIFIPPGRRAPPLAQLSSVLSACLSVRCL